MCCLPSDGAPLVHHDHARPVEVYEALRLFHHGSELLRLEGLRYSICALKPEFTNPVTEWLTLLLSENSILLGTRVNKCQRAL